jgi:hypothetical protein
MLEQYEYLYTGSEAGIVQSTAKGYKLKRRGWILGRAKKISLSAERSGRLSFNETPIQQLPGIYPRR